MTAVLKSIALGCVLILISASILLYSDLGSRRSNAPRPTNSGKPLKVAMVQHSSIPALDEGLKGALEALHDRGFSDGGRIIVRRYNAEGDIGTANAIAKEVTNGDFDLIFSVSTVSLQTIANANKFATPHRHHVFGLVSDPYAVGVGINRSNHLDHPPYMTGVGSLAPVEDLFKMAVQFRPSLKRVGIVWDPSEANSVVTTGLGRSVCSRLGLTLVEANAENSTAITEAVGSLISRNVEAIWVSPDQVAMRGMDLIVQKARVAGIPVFSSNPPAKPWGTLFDLGSNYRILGHTVGNIAADVLDGRSPAAIPVENIVPVTLHVNRQALKTLRDHWEIPESVAERADVLVDDTGRHTKIPEAAGQKTPN
jgi:ABC-type uncharacterized transport system substrate-binding protein